MRKGEKAKGRGEGKKGFFYLLDRPRKEHQLRFIGKGREEFLFFSEKNLLFRQKKRVRLCPSSLLTTGSRRKREKPTRNREGVGSLPFLGEDGREKESPFLYLGKHGRTCFMREREGLLPEGKKKNRAAGSERRGTLQQILDPL